MKQGLLREAQGMAGELMLGHLCETAKSLLTDLNAPEGDCAICLEPLVQPPGSNLSPFVRKLPCFHCLHRSAFKPQQSTHNEILGG